MTRLLRAFTPFTLNPTIHREIAAALGFRRYLRWVNMCTFKCYKTLRSRLDQRMLYLLTWEFIENTHLP